MNDKDKKLKVKTPKQPESWTGNPNKWLNTLDIENILREYEKIYDDFKLIEVSPIDFDTIINGFCISDSLCKLDIKDLYNKNIKKIGIVFNLDKHDQSGSHWVALYIDIEKFSIYFSDSTGHKPSEEIIVLMKRIKQQGDEMIINNKIENPNNIHLVIKHIQTDKNNCIILNKDTDRINDNNIIRILYFDNELKNILSNNKLNKIKDCELIFKVNKKKKKKIELQKIEGENLLDNKEAILIQTTFRYFYNDKQHQTEDTECGVYSLYWIINLLVEENNNKNKFLEIVNNIIGDDEMSKYRNIYWK